MESFYIISYNCLWIYNYLKIKSLNKQLNIKALAGKAMCMHKYFYCSTVYNSKSKTKLETTRAFVTRRTVKLQHLHTTKYYAEILKD